MSFEISSYEILEINNESPETEKIADALADYLQQFNHMLGLESLYISRLNLIVDDETAELESFEAEEYGNTYLVGIADDGSAFFGRENVERLLWPNDTRMGRLIQCIPTAKHIRLESSFVITQLLDTDYGYSYFHKLFGEVKVADQLRDVVTYKCLEYYDSDDIVVSYRFEKESGEVLDEEPEFSDDLTIISDITSWYGKNFGLEISVEEPLETTEEQDFLQRMQEWLSVFGEYLYIDEEDLSCFAVYGSIELPGIQLPLFTSYLQSFYDFARIHNGEFNLVSEFTPNEQDEFARLSLTVKNGEIATKAMRY